MKTVLQHLFDKDSLAEVSIETLDKFAVQYPYCAVGPFLLTKKLQELDDERQARQYQKTLVYFHNPLWLHYQLNTINYNSDSVLPVYVPPASTDLVEEVILHQEKVPGAPEERLGTLSANAGNLLTTNDQISKNGIAHNEEAINEEEEIEKAQSGEPLNFQSLHTVDYFASQGIKVTNEFTPEDKLGKQLKSFTEWLKTMRRLPEATIEQVLETSHDREVEKYASSSLEEKEVLTEAMAEVLVKQGKQEKAAEVYRKLSLLNPHKSAYFAAKLEGL